MNIPCKCCIHILNSHQVFQLENAQEKCEKVVKVSISQLGPAYFSTSCIGSQFDPPFKAYHSIFQKSVILNKDIGQIICAKQSVNS